jgi:hypothetical protein
MTTGLIHTPPGAVSTAVTRFFPEEAMTEVPRLARGRRRHAKSALRAWPGDCDRCSGWGVALAAGTSVSRWSGGAGPPVSADFHAASLTPVSGELVAELSVVPPGDGGDGEVGLAEHG